MEIIVNKLIKRLDVKISENAGFKDRFKAVAGSLKSKDVRLAELEEKLPPIFWDVRNKVVHDGYEPNAEELNTIITWVSQVLEKLRALDIGAGGST